MKLKISLVRSSDRRLQKKPAREPVPARSAAGAQMISTKFASYLGEPVLEALKNQKPRRIPPAIERRPSAAPSGGLLSRALGWLNGRYTSPKRLRVVETIALGDKRMVAVIQAEGRRFLVGGGPSGVSLLTPLDQPQLPLDDLESTPRLTELAG